MTTSGSGETKQEIIDQISEQLGIGPFRVGMGSSEPAEFFHQVARALGIDITGATSKPEIAQRIAKFGGVPWDSTCDSRSTTSGGGSTVTNIGLRRIRDAVTLIQSGLNKEEQFSINVRPQARSLRLFKNLTFKAWYALGEFIDNSITSALFNIDSLNEKFGEQYRLSVSIAFDAETNSLVIDDNAAGIALADLTRALKTSEPPPDVSKGLGLHGVGLKAAGFWWGERIVIETFPLGTPNGWNVELDLRALDFDDNENVAVRKIPHRGVTGTKITVQRLWNGVPRGRTVGAIRAFLPSIYRTFLGPRPTVDGADEDEISNSDLRLDLLLDGGKLEYNPPRLLTEVFWPNTDGPLEGGKPVAWQEDVEVQLFNGKVIRGWVGILETMSRDIAGFALQYRGKSIAGIASNSEEEVASISLERGAYKPRRIFGQPGSYMDQSIVGEFDLTDFGKSITTDSVTWSTEEEEDFVEKLYGIMRRPDKDFIAQAANLRRRKISSKAAETQSEVVTRETSILSDSLNESGISHNDEGVENQTPPFQGNESDTVLESPETSHAIHDAEGHIHSVSLRCVDRSESPFLDVQAHADFGHQITLNLGHKSISDLGPIEDKVRSLLIRIVLAIASAEIFLEGTDLERSRFRRKMNAVLEARSRFMRGRES